MALERSNEQTRNQNQRTAKGKVEGLSNASAGASNLVHQERSRVTPQEDRLKTLLKTPGQKEIQREKKADVTTRAVKTQEAIRQGHPDRSGNYSSRMGRLSLNNRHKTSTRSQHKHGPGEKKVTGETLGHDRNEVLAIRANNQNLINRQALRNTTIQQRQQEADPSALKEGAEKEASPGTVRDGFTGLSDSPMVGGDNTIEQTAAHARFGAQDEGLSMETSPAESQNFGTAIEEHTKLVDVVGPEAVLTFKEKLREVWVMLDENASSELDVLARMPANLLGASAAELLMVESPQGIHFVAFLRNKNDFEILANFDRHDLLPYNPSRQLVEAAIVATEQLDQIAKDACEKLGRGVSERASSSRGQDEVLDQMRAIWTFAKRRRARYRRMIDYWVNELDDFDLRGDAGEVPADERENMNESEVFEQAQDEDQIIELSQYLGDSRSRLKKAG